MINSKVDHCKTLDEFYYEIVKQQTEAHGEDYCAQHDAIRKYMKECYDYKELGTHQGGTAAAACLTKPFRVELIDLDMSKFNASKHLFYNYCTDMRIELVAKEMSSVDPASVSECDLLLIDSYHHPNHLLKELTLHLPKVKKYIILHDTSIINGKKNDSLFRCAQEYITRQITPWVVIERNEKNVGYTVLGNTINI